MRLIHAVLIMAVFAMPVHATELDSILSENARAQGGAQLADIQAVRIKLHIQEPTFEVEGVYTATREGRMRIDIYAGGQRVFAEGLMDGPEGVCAWEWTSNRRETRLLQGSRSTSRNW